MKDSGDKTTPKGSVKDRKGRKKRKFLNERNQKERMKQEQEQEGRKTVR